MTSDATREPSKRGGRDLLSVSKGFLSGTSRGGISWSPLAALSLVFLTFGQLLVVGGFQEFCTDIGFVGLLASAFVYAKRGNSYETARPLLRGNHKVVWRWTLFGLGAFGVLSIQRWFIPGTENAGGDIPPPEGIAWIGKIFHNFAWSGGNLGAPASNQVELPWAAVSWLVHNVGGTGALAQRVWLSALVGAVFVSAGMFARALGLSSLSGVVLAMLYFFNPITVSSVGDNTVFLVAMALVPALAAAVISFGSLRLRLWQLVGVFVLAGPFLGYAYSNPPIALMVVLTTCATPLLVWAKEGRESAALAVQGVAMGGLFLAAFSAYWFIPAISSLGSIATGKLSTLSDWAFTESRSTLRNGLWLNTAWGWNFSSYYPYAGDFTRFPLDVIVATVPLSAFLILSVRQTKAWFAGRVERFLGVLALLTLGVILLSNGTKSPGNLLFDPLYKLKYGWLLREPGRFLVAAALGFATLSAFFVENFRGRTLPWSLAQRFELRRWSRITTSFMAAMILVVVAVLGAFPLWTGQLILGPVDGFPSTHVTFPTYWTTTAQYLNSTQAPSGSLMVLPANDFYQMPYTWYYGNDGFIVNMMNRNVVNPSAQGYGAVSSELLSAVKLESSSILDGRWKEAGRILGAVGTPIVLVRGDINSRFPGRSIVSPVKLLHGLLHDPEMETIYNNGPLSLFALKSAFREPLRNFATVNTDKPNLNFLATLPRGTALISSKPLKGRLSITQLPSLSRWDQGSTTLSLTRVVPSGREYFLRTPTSMNATGVSFDLTGIEGRPLEKMRMRIQIGKNKLTDGDFSKGLWGPVGNCNSALRVTDKDVLNALRVAKVGPNRSTALQLSASVDSACEAHSLPLHRGRILLRFSVRRLSGAQPRICVLEEPSGICASTGALNAQQSWSRVTDIIQPVKGTKSLQLFLYADALGNGTTSVEQYANVSEHILPSNQTPFILGVPKRLMSGGISVFETGFSDAWASSENAKHVEVDGLRNGWLTPPSIGKISAPRNSITSVEWEREISMTLLAITLSYLVWLVTKKKRSQVERIRGIPQSQKKS